MSRRKVNQIDSTNAENPQLHWNHSSLNRLVIARTDRQTDAAYKTTREEECQPFGMYSTTDEWLLLRGFTGPGWQRAKVRAVQPVRQTGQRQASVFHPQFFSRGLFTANPLGLRGAAGPVSNAAPPLWRPESLAALWRQIKELDAALCVSEVTLVRPDPDPWKKKPGGSLPKFDSQVSFCAARGYYSLAWLDAQTTSDLSWDWHQIYLPGWACYSAPPLSPPPPPPLLDILNYLDHFSNSVNCFQIKSTLMMSNSTWYLSLWCQDFLTELKPYFSLNKRTLLLFKVSIQTLATSPNRYVTGIPASVANSNYLVKGIRALVR